MDRHEEAVMQLLTANGETFVAPKYELADGWQCPAFVALRPHASRSMWSRYLPRAIAGAGQPPQRTCR